MVGAGTATAAAGAAGVPTEAARPGLGLPAGGGEDCLTLGLKLWCVFTIAWLEKEWRWRGWEEKMLKK